MDQFPIHWHEFKLLQPSANLLQPPPPVFNQTMPFFSSSSSSSKILVVCMAAVAISSGVRAEKEVAETFFSGPEGVGVGIPGVGTVSVGGPGYGAGVVSPGVSVGGPVGVSVGAPAGYTGVNVVNPPTTVVNGGYQNPPPSSNGATATATATANASARKLRSAE
ncbi:unnamed protein product [Phytophthora fragariaefolia]|uniref:Unnamed protein product n=1 Tax=Phytophthora fragariaefolia TaxID=1490495 RepID=A0A9W6TLG2_9STRA|nr:unnamed protein product [Phytophthora fragariaefolia]